MCVGAWISCWFLVELWLECEYNGNVLTFWHLLVPLLFVISSGRNLPRPRTPGVKSRLFLLSFLLEMRRSVWKLRSHIVLECLSTLWPHVDVGGAMSRQIVQLQMLSLQGRNSCLLDIIGRVWLLWQTILLHQGLNTWVYPPWAGSINSTPAIVDHGFLGERQAEQVHAKMLGVADGRVIIWYYVLVQGVKARSVWLECRRGTLSVLIGAPFFQSYSYMDESLALVGSLIDLICRCEASSHLE